MISSFLLIITRQNYREICPVVKALNKLLKTGLQVREFNVRELGNTAGSSAITIMRCAACECWGRTVTPRQALCGGNQNFQRNEAAIENIVSKLELVRAAQSRIERHSAETTGNLQQNEAAISTAYLILTQGDSSWHEVTCQSFFDEYDNSSSSCFPPRPR